MIVVSQSADGSKRMVIVTEKVKGKYKSITQHQVKKNGEWVHNPKENSNVQAN